MTIPTEQGSRLAEGLYDYTVDDHLQAKERWRLTRLPDGRQHIQTLLGAGQQVLYGMDLVFNANNTIDEVQARIQSGEQEHYVDINCDGAELVGTLRDGQHETPIALTMPAGTMIFPEAIAMRMVVGLVLDLSHEAEYTLPLCLIPVMDSAYPPLQPLVVKAQITVLGVEDVDLLMATVAATHVLIEWPHHPPQHAWYDERHFPIQWSWVGHGSDGASVTHTFALTRYTWVS